MGTHPYAVELWLSSIEGEGAREGMFNVDLFDRERASVQVSDIVDLSFGGEEEIPGLMLSGAKFLEFFHRGEAGIPNEGLLFGRYLFGRLFRQGRELKHLWNEITSRRRAAKRPLRMELHLPRGEAARVAEIPFELLADDEGFLFQRHGASLVRTLRGLEARTFELRPDHSILVAWANPAVENQLP